MVQRCSSFSGLRAPRCPEIFLTGSSTLRAVLLIFLLLVLVGAMVHAWFAARKFNPEERDRVAVSGNDDRFVRARARACRVRISVQKILGDLRAAWPTWYNYSLRPMLERTPLTARAARQASAAHRVDQC